MTAFFYPDGKAAWLQPLKTIVRVSGGKTPAASTDSTPVASTESKGEESAPAAGQADANGMLDGKFVETRHISVELYDRSVDGGTDAGDNAWTQWIQAQMLVAFRDNAETLLGADASKMVPFSMSYDVGWRAANLIESFMDPAITDKELYVNGFDDRKYTENGTKDAVAVLNKWYNDGLIWKDFALSNADDSAEDDMIKAGFVGAFMHNYDYPFRGGVDSINAVLKAQQGDDAKFIAVNCFEDKNGTYTKYRYSEGGDRKVFFPATNDEPVASLCYLEFMSEASTVEYLQAGEEGINHTVADNGAWVLIGDPEGHHEYFVNSGKNIDMTINCNGLRLATEELTNLSLAYSYPEVDPADVQQAIEAAKLDARAPKAVSVGDIVSEAEGTDLTTKRDAGFDNSIVASVADFEATWDKFMKEYLAAGGQAIMDERLAAWEATYGAETMLP